MLLFLLRMIMTGLDSKTDKRTLPLWRGRFAEWAIWALLLLSPGCASVFSSEAMKAVNPDIPFADLQKNPEAFQGKTVLLGGKIIKTENLSEKTVLVVSHRTLNSNDKPIGEEQSEGRFMVSVHDFLDPAIYREDRKITVIGRVVGSSVRPLNGTTYRYPIIEKKELHLWPVEEPLSTEPRIQFGIGIGFGF
ncbi:MAG: Slp family lipoprotein [Desulfatiglandaceae bacterium]